MKRIIILTPGSAWPGFRLAGMEQLLATPQSAAELLKAQTQDTAVGLVVLDERLRAHIPEELLARLDQQYPGKVTILPTPEAGETSFALELIRQAIGYHVRIKG